MFNFFRANPQCNTNSWKGCLIASKLNCKIVVFYHEHISLHIVSHFLDFEQPFFCWKICQRWAIAICEYLNGESASSELYGRPQNSLLATFPLEYSHISLPRRFSSKKDCSQFSHALTWPASYERHNLLHNFYFVIVVSCWNASLLLLVNCNRTAEERRRKTLSCEKNTP